MYTIVILNYFLLLIISLFNSQDSERSITYYERTCTGTGETNPIEGSFNVELFSTGDLHALRITTNSYYNDSEIIVDTTYNGKNVNIEICGYLRNKSGASYFWRSHAKCFFFLNTNFDSLYVTLKHKSVIDTFLVNYLKTKYKLRKISKSDVFINNSKNEIVIRSK